MAHAQALLAGAGIPEAALEAEVLVRHVLGLDRAALFAYPEHPLTPEQEAALKALLARRRRREPLAYILGFREFYGLAFHITSAVLVPRPETEALVDEALRWASVRGEQAEKAPEPVAKVPSPLVGEGEDEGDAHPHPNPLPSRERGWAGEALTIADIGTGSGCVAVSLAAHLPSSTLIATDISPAALEVARGNARRHGVEERMAFHCGPLLEPLRQAVDLIVANLPYIPDGELARLQPEVRDYEPREALAGGPDGLTLLRGLLEQAPPRIQPGGALMLEMDPRQRATLVAATHRCFPRSSVRVLQDLAGRDRVLVVSTPSSP